jgi:hypothetical protein
MSTELHCGHSDPSLVAWFELMRERFAVFRLVCSWWKIARRSAVPGKQPKFQSDVMGGLYPGIAITGVEALVAMGLVIAFM